MKSKFHAHNCLALKRLLKLNLHSLKNIPKVKIARIFTIIYYGLPLDFYGPFFGYFLN